MDVKGKVAIVTGSASGVGAATARLLAAEGANIVVNYSRSEAEAKETQAACEAAGAQTVLVKGDISEDSACRALARAAIERWGRIDVLVNNAGTTRFTPPGDLEALNAEDFRRIFDVNVIGTYQMTRACAPHLKANGRGAIVNVSALGGVRGTGSSIAYGASKGAINTMTLAFARQLAPEVTVNAVCPGFIEGRWLRVGMGEEAYLRFKERIEQTAPLRRVSTPEGVAQYVLWFITGPDLVTGEFLIIDTGQHLGGA